MALYGVISYVLLKRRIREAIRLEDGTWETDRIGTAFILGYFRPRIYLPMGMGGGSAGADSEARADPSETAGSLDQADWIPCPGCPLVQSSGLDRILDAVPGNRTGLR